MKQKGFTLIELLVVVTIIGILTTVGMFAYEGYTAGAKRNTAEMICHEVINEVKTRWIGCQSGVPCYLKHGGSGNVDYNADWCTFNSANPSRTNMRAQAFVGHYGTHSWGNKWGPRNPYRTKAAAVNTSCPSDDKLKPGCIEIIGTDKNDSGCGHCNPPIKAGEFVFQCYNLDSKGKLTKYREHFQTQ